MNNTVTSLVLHTKKKRNLWLNFPYFISKGQHSYTTITEHYKNALKLHYRFNNQIANKGYSKLSGYSH